MKITINDDMNIILNRINQLNQNKKKIEEDLSNFRKALAAVLGRETDSAIRRTILNQLDVAERGEL